MRYSILSQILKGFWLIDESAAKGYLPIVANLIEGKTIEREESKLPDFVAASFSTTGKVTTYKKYDDAPNGSIAVIKVEGALMKADADCGGPPGTATLSQRFIEADAHPNISGHILLIDSPGGAVDGTEDFANKVKGASKPVITYVDGLMASAAYWIGSSSSEIILNGKSAIVGSIGTMISLPSFAKYFEQKGIKIHDIRAEESKDKNEAFYQAQEGNYKPIQQELLNPLNAVFLEAVKTNRAGKLKGNNALTGKVFIGQAAIDEGLADSIGSFDFAVQRATELANEKQSINQTQKPMKIKAAWTALVALLGFTTAAAEQDLPAVSEEHLEKANAEIGRLSDLTATLTTEKTDLTGKLETSVASETQLIADLKAANAKITDLEAKVKEYGSQPGAMGTKAIKTKEEIEADQKHSWVDPESEHNKTAREMLGK